ncbi:MAG: electron transfer flavoprotein subunit beta/FixA family protein [Planctomycetota bacterium]
MHLVVCVKQILDPEIPARDFKIDREKKEAERGSANLVPNIFCENALETALQFREKNGGKITAVTFGPDSAEDVLRKALALKVDDAVHVLNPLGPHAGPLAIAKALAAAVRKLQGVDLVMVGRESGDWGVGQTGGLLAEELAFPCISFVDHLEADDAGLKIRRQTEAGREFFTAAGPLVVTITNDEHNVPRIPKTKDVMMSFKKPLTKWSLADLGLTEAGLKDESAFYEIADLFIPEKKTQCEFVQGDSLDAKIDGFAKRIHEVLSAM